MNKLILIFSWILLIAGASAGENIQVNFTGTVSDATCEIQTDSQNPEVNLGELYNQDLEEAGSASEWVNFNITLFNCPPALKTVSAAFSGTPDGNDASLYKSTGDASNVAVELQDQNTQRALGHGAVDTVNILPSGNAVFNLQARAKTVVGNVTAGTIDSLIEMTYTYN
ncbi:fimbrial protein [Pseudescherichia sp.]|uniref:fimbrial protein n=1 Tax=Pseudescherichia sp. TaxID=2055881 RepID=UPI002898A3F2|nr:fimbrial protein [Pseudescherichia sp.]